MFEDTTFRVIRIEDHESLIAFWRGCPGLIVSDSDAIDKFSLYLRRNPETNFLAEIAGRIAGTALAAHDGRRGILRHVAVHPEHRRRGLATELVNRCLEALRAEGIERSYAIVLSGNGGGIDFWKRRGWEHLDECLLFAGRRVSRLAEASPDFRDQAAAAAAGSAPDTSS